MITQLFSTLLEACENQVCNKRYIIPIIFSPITCTKHKFQNFNANVIDPKPGPDMGHHQTGCEPTVMMLSYVPPRE